LWQEMGFLKGLGRQEEVVNWDRGERLLVRFKDDQGKTRGEERKGGLFRNSLKSRGFGKKKKGNVKRQVGAQGGQERED